MFILALSPLESCPRPVSLPPETVAALTAELERDEDFPAPVAGRCALCHGVLAASEADSTGVAHDQCGRDAMLEIENESFDEWVESCERTYAGR